jgi:hypothetical protein
VIATCIWLLGAAAIHVREMVGEGNYNPGNAGVVFLHGHHWSSSSHRSAHLLPARGANKDGANR